MEEVHGDMEEVHGVMEEVYGDMQKVHGDMDEVHGDMEEVCGAMELYGAMDEVCGALQKLYRVMSFPPPFTSILGSLLPAPALPGLSLLPHQLPQHLLHLAPAGCLQDQAQLAPEVGIDPPIPGASRRLELGGFRLSLVPFAFSTCKKPS